MHNCTITKTFRQHPWEKRSARGLAAEWASWMQVLAEESGITVGTKVDAPMTVHIVNHAEVRKATATVQFENETDYALFKLKHPDE